MVFWFKNIAKIFQEEILLGINEENYEKNKNLSNSEYLDQIVIQIDFEKQLKKIDKRNEESVAELSMLLVSLLTFPSALFIIITNQSIESLVIALIINLPLLIVCILGLEDFNLKLQNKNKNKKIFDLKDALFESNIDLIAIFEYINKYSTNAEKEDILNSIKSEKEITSKIFQKLYNLDLSSKESIEKLSKTNDTEILKFLEENEYIDPPVETQRIEKIEKYVVDKDTAKKMEHIERLEQLTRETLVLKKESIMYQ